MSRRSARRRWSCALAVAAVAAPGAQPAAAMSDFPIASTAAAADPEPPPLRAAVAAARAKIGSGYAMGATGPSAFDCSGLTMHALGRAGVQLARSSFAQYAAGRPVERSEIRPGDLVFFSTAGPGPSHVGVATGRATAISATSSGGVVEHSTTDAYWGGSYVGARRVGR